MYPTRWTASLVALGLTLGAATPAAASPPGPSTRPKNTPTVSTVALITGDSVRITSRPGARDQIAFQPGPGSTSEAARTTVVDGHTYVVPSAAAADVAAGRLDRTLFDVTTLVAEGATKSTPVIVRYSGSAAARQARTAIAGTAGGRVLSSVGARATRVEQAPAFWKSVDDSTAIAKVSLDRRVTANLDQSVPQIGGPAAWQRGLTGKGVKIAVLDTGIDPTHPDFAGRIAAAENFSEAADAIDHHGHGTHVASIAAGAGAKHRGVAPEATLLSGKVLNDYGQGYDSSIIAGMEWATAQGAAVVNLSLGGGPSDGTDELSQAVNRISKQTGALFVIAAGNCRFPSPGTISTPAAADEALAIGNLQRDGATNESSCNGPRKGDHALKPELSAPGTGIVAARADGTSMGQPVDDDYTAASGTSMASPHVAGTAALIAQAHPQWKADALKVRLISTADPQPTDSIARQGAGRVDADQATAGGVTVDAGQLDLGRLAWPHPASDVVTRELTYRNPTDTPVTLRLAVDQQSTKLSTGQLVVPAQGEAKVTVSADRAAQGVGDFAGRITATADGADPLVTVIGWYAEPELYDLTITGIARDGGPANADVLLNRLDGPQLDLGPGLPYIPVVNGTAKVRVPPGKYDASTVLFGAAADGVPGRFDLVLSDEFEVRKATTATLDGRKTQTVDLTAQGQPANATARETSLLYDRKAPELARTDGLSGIGSRSIYAATRTAAPTLGTAEVAFGKRMEHPAYQVNIAGGPTVTALDFFFGPRFTGRKDLQVYDGGSGTPAELTGAKGKAALIRYDGSTLNGVLAKNAEDAGAAAVILYRPMLAGDGAVPGYWAIADQDSATIPALRVSRLSAKKLLEANSTIRITGQAATPYVYDLAIPWAQRIPANTELTVGRGQLATVNESFGAHVPGMLISEARSAYTPAGLQLNSFLPPLISAPTRRTSYVLANQTKWGSQVVLDNGHANLVQNTEPRTYHPGSTTAERWLAPVQNAGLPDGTSLYQHVRQDDGALSLWLSAIGQGPRQGTTEPGGTHDLTVTRNGAELVATDYPAAYIEDVPAEPADYTIELRSTAEQRVFRYSTTIDSQWRFRSKGTDTERMPLVLADLDVPQADASSQVRTGQPITIELALRHQFGSGSTAKFTKPKLQLSYDGKQWTDLPLTATGPAKYAAKVTHPASATGQSPSLRLTAADTEGNTLTQEITAAYGLK
ncbi:S8 family serine peptidase [Kribbella sandramycini]|uniref:S8 family serine peptidase n=1 Tax=Kribbella sandramycini TaxID=60450 RepID=A0A7Y4KZF3_9ACTN|nr:S8 family serine peptidase [Kribbella sandramycini]MBB6565220.1 subtilisin family serine protease [Kribbella sandramycini]NOL41489.1 S8 family serine peptidase [Kribbella sandramycini]